MRRHEFGTLDGVRGAAAIIVVIWHIGLKLGVPIGSSYLAVDLFFMLSGFVMAHAYEQRLRDGWVWRRFALTRAIRLWPLYLACSAAGLIVAASSGADVGGWRGTLVSTVLMLPRLHGRAGLAYPLDDPAWSLACEVAINAVYGLVGWRLGGRALLGVVAASFLAMVLGAHVQSALHVGLNLGALTQHLWIGLARVSFAFPVGVLIHQLWRAGALPAFPVSALAVVAGAAVALVAWPMPAAHSLAYALTVVGLIFPGLIALGATTPIAGRARAVAAWSARISYPLYLIHMVLLEAAVWAAGRFDLPRAPTLIAAGGLAIVLADVLDRRFDKPVRDWLSRAAALKPAVTDAALPL